MIRAMRTRISLAATVLAVAAGASLTAPAAASPATAPTGIAVNRWVSGSLRTATETDWYAFTLSRRGYVSVVLGDLPADYNLSLYDASDTRLGLSDRGGTRFEVVDRVLDAGTYRIRVGSTSGSSVTAYAVIARVVSAPRVGTLTARLQGATDSAVGEFVNASEQWAMVGRASAVFFAADGRKLGTFGPDFLETWFVVPPHGRVPFSLPLLGKRPAGTVKVMVTPEAFFVASRSAAKLSTTGLTRSRATVNGIVMVRTDGTVRNGSTRRLRATLLDRAYDRRGVLRSVGQTQPRLLGAGAASVFSCQLPGFAPTTMATMTLSAKAFETTDVLPGP